MLAVSFIIPEFQKASVSLEIIFDLLDTKSTLDPRSP